jgi:CubicO group peptidase (beta-lactamase class C family)
MRQAMFRPQCLGISLALGLGCCVLSPAAAEPDELNLGKAQGYPIGDGTQGRNEAYRVGAWSAWDRVPGILTQTVARSSQAHVLPKASQPVDIRYRYRNASYNLDEYLERQRVTGLLILKNGQIVVERYRYGRQDDARFLSFSMAKSVTSLLVGVAHAQGWIKSLDDVAGQYLKELQGSAYGQTRIRDLLRMSSGVTFSERYDGADDVSRLSRAVATGWPATLEVLRQFQDRHSPPGTKFVYASAETEVLGRVLTAATGKTMAELTQQWIWEPLGAEHDAFWCTGKDSQAAAYFCFNASLRDWGRLGVMLAQDGRIGGQIGGPMGGPMGGRQIIPREYLLDATDASRQPSAFRPYQATPYTGYGYQFWLHPFKERTFVMQGVYGQAVYVQPASGLVMVHTAVYAQPSGQQDPQPYTERNALWMGVVDSLGGSSARY